MKRYIRTVSIEKQTNPLKEELQQIRLKERSNLEKREKAYKRFKAQQEKRKKKKKNKIRKFKYSSGLMEYRANLLESELPASEKWFRELYLKEDIHRTFSEDYFKDKFNKPFNNRYIPDVCNLGYKYIIEIDGAIHNNPEVIIKDKKRDYYFEKRGFLVIRIKYGDNQGYKNAIELIKQRIKEFDIIEINKRKKCHS